MFDAGGTEKSSFTL